MGRFHSEHVPKSEGRRALLRRYRDSQPLSQPVDEGARRHAHPALEQHVLTHGTAARVVVVFDALYVLRSLGNVRRAGGPPAQWGTAPSLQQELDAEAAARERALPACERAAKHGPGAGGAVDTLTWGEWFARFRATCARALHRTPGVRTLVLCFDKHEHVPLAKSVVHTGRDSTKVHPDDLAPLHVALDERTPPPAHLEAYLHDRQYSRRYVLQCLCRTLLLSDDAELSLRAALLPGQRVFVDGHCLSGVDTSVLCTGAPPAGHLLAETQLNEEELAHLLGPTEELHDDSDSGSDSGSDSNSGSGLGSDDAALADTALADSVADEEEVVVLSDTEVPVDDDDDVLVLSDTEVPVDEAYEPESEVESSDSGAEPEVESEHESESQRIGAAVHTHDPRLAADDPRRPDETPLELAYGAERCRRREEFRNECGEADFGMFWWARALDDEDWRHSEGITPQPQHVVLYGTDSDLMYLGMLYVWRARHVWGWRALPQLYQHKRHSRPNGSLINEHHHLNELLRAVQQDAALRTTLPAPLRVPALCAAMMAAGSDYTERHWGVDHECFMRAFFTHAPAASVVRLDAAPPPTLDDAARRAEAHATLDPAAWARHRRAQRAAVAEMHVDATAYEQLVFGAHMLRSTAKRITALRAAAKRTQHGVPTAAVLRAQAEHGAAEALGAAPISRATLTALLDRRRAPPSARDLALSAAQLLYYVRMMMCVGDRQLPAADLCGEYGYALRVPARGEVYKNVYRPVDGVVEGTGVDDDDGARER